MATLYLWCMGFSLWSFLLLQSSVSKALGAVAAAVGSVVWLRAIERAVLVPHELSCSGVWDPPDQGLNMPASVTGFLTLPLSHLGSPQSTKVSMKNSEVGIGKDNVWENHPPVCFLSTVLFSSSIFLNFYLRKRRANIGLAEKVCLVLEGFTGRIKVRDQSRAKRAEKEEVCHLKSRRDEEDKREKDQRGQAQEHIWIPQLKDRSLGGESERSNDLGSQELQEQGPAAHPRGCSSRRMEIPRRSPVFIVVPIERCHPRWLKEAAEVETRTDGAGIQFPWLGALEFLCSWGGT